MNEWYFLPLVIGFVMGFASGLIFALRIYKKIERDCDREWAKRQGMREMSPQRVMRESSQQRRERLGLKPVLRQTIL